MLYEVITAVDLSDAAKALAGAAREPFGLIFADPPYGKDLLRNNFV